MQQKSPHPIGTTIFSPGKIVLAGEYAVLDGCPALVLALNRGVLCTIQNGTGISTPNDDQRFVVEALQKHQYHQHFAFSNWNPVLHLDGKKPGFGGSAAACVASCLAAGLDPSLAFDIHQKIQGGGSGIDIASAIHGGMIEYTIQDRNIEKKYPVLTPLVIWSTTSAQTSPRIQKYLKWKQREAFVNESHLLISQFTSDPVNTSNQLFSLLCSIDQKISIDYLTPQIEEICAIVRKNNGGAKPSGAGGGDCVVAFFHTKEEQDRCKEILQNQYKYQCIDYRVASGAHVIYPEVQNEFQK